MMIHEITENVGKYKARKRIGRGRGSGHGKTSGRGHKGSKSRAGWSSRYGYEGGRMPYFRQMPKLGFSNEVFRNVYHIVNVEQINEHFNDGDIVNPESLVNAGLIRDTKIPVKVLGNGELTKKLNITAAKLSKSAVTKIEEAGGTVNLSVKTKWKRTPKK